MLRFFAPKQADRLLIVNFGPDLHLDPAPEPLLAPPERMRWDLYGRVRICTTTGAAQERWKRRRTGVCRVMRRWSSSRYQSSSANLNL